LVETWTAEVHRGQRLTGDVMTAMDSLGFELLDVGVGAPWHRRSRQRAPLLGKAQVVGMDLFYLKRDITSGGKGGLRLLKAAALAEVFGFPDRALELVDQADDAPWVVAARRIILESARARQSPRARLRRLVGRLRSRPAKDFAPLHP
jgi:hypothetical protein